MFKKKNNDLELEDYNEYSINSTMDFTNNDNYYYEDDDSDYEDNYNDYDNDDTDVEYIDDDYNDKDSENETYEELDENGNSDFTTIFLIIATWFGRLGIVIAVILVLYFLFNGKFTTLLLYVLGLAAAYFFGYGFMYLLEKFNNN